MEWRSAATPLHANLTWTVWAGILRVTLPKANHSALLALVTILVLHKYLSQMPFPLPLHLNLHLVCHWFELQVGIIHFIIIRSSESTIITSWLIPFAHAKCSSHQFYCHDNETAGQLYYTLFVAQNSITKLKYSNKKSYVGAGESLAMYRQG